MTTTPPTQLADLLPALTEDQRRALAALAAVRELNPVATLPATLRDRTVSDLALLQSVPTGHRSDPPIPVPGFYDDDNGQTYRHADAEAGSPMVEVTAPGDQSRTFVNAKPLRVTTTTTTDESSCSCVGGLGTTYTDVHTVTAAGAVVPAQFLDGVTTNAGAVVPVLVLTLTSANGTTRHVIALRDPVMSPEVALADLGDRITTAIEHATTAAGRINRA